MTRYQVTAAVPPTQTTWAFPLQHVDGSLGVFQSEESGVPAPALPLTGHITLDRHYRLLVLGSFIIRLHRTASYSR